MSAYSVVVGVLALLGGAALNVLGIPEDAPLHDYVGLMQRAIILILTFPCLMVLAMRLHRIG